MSFAIVVAHFWPCFNKLPTLDKESDRYSIYIMKEGIKPAWEDPMNANGGSWHFRIPKVNTQRAWLEGVLAVIGEQFDGALADGDDICGISLNKKRDDNTLEFWNKKWSEAGIESLKNRITELVSGTADAAAFYKRHIEHDAFNLRGSRSNSQRAEPRRQGRSAEPISGEARQSSFRSHASGYSS